MGKVVDMSEQRIPVPLLVGNRSYCSDKCPHNQNQHPVLAFSNICMINGQAVSPSGGGPCWPAIESDHVKLAEAVAALGHG